MGMAAPDSEWLNIKRTKHKPKRCIEHPEVARFGQEKQNDKHENLRRNGTGGDKYALQQTRDCADKLGS